ncbi:endonuclease/exonuclease/phosphatase [Actinomadura craniellae]|uniref:Endonuclease/exonuclease/phosphatase n=1 Tax=Actinomadura craniellae TaxID=2231787 RepID=A0A365H712_9ACTN|nr:endonuclease/exonuclease/phosphatase [Actinomadura craniellae]
MSRPAGQCVVVASFNTRGVPVVGSNLTERYRAIAAAFESSDVDVVAFQEVFTYCHLRRLTAGMPSFRHLGYQPSPVGPAAGLATLSRLPITRCGYQRFPLPQPDPALPRLTRLKAALKGSLTTALARYRLRVINTHPVANEDGDWSESNRFHDLQQGQLTDLAQLVREDPVPTIVCGDFNVAHNSTLHCDFMAASGLVDAFAGRCPPTFHAAYLSPGRTPHCIDFILTTDSIEIESTATLFTDQEPLPSGPSHLSDHIGLRARVRLVG